MKLFDEYGKKILIFTPYKIFRINQEVYLYKINESSLFQIDQNLIRILNCEGRTLKDTYRICNQYFTENEFEQLIMEMENERFIVSNHVENKPSEAENIQLSALTLMVVQECNMRCKYCYGDGGEYNNRGKMNMDTAKRAIDFLVENSIEKKLAIAFMGGEPLLNFKLIKEIVLYCAIQEKKHNKKFSYTMTTNGTLITPDIESFLIQNRIVTQISIDGEKEKHDANRIFVNNQGSYDQVEKQTQSMRNQNLLTARATISPGNTNYIKVFEHLNKLNFRAVPIAVAENLVSDSEFDEIIESYREYILYFKKLICEKNYNKARKITELMNALEKLEYTNKRRNGCGAAKYMVAVDIEGKCYPCHRFVGIEKYCLGTIESLIDRKMFLKESAVEGRQECEKCWAKNLCLGGCPYVNYESSGAITNISVKNCKMTKMMFEELIKIYIKLSEDDKKLLFISQ